VIRPGSPVKPCSKNSLCSARAFPSHREVQTPFPHGFGIVGLPPRSSAKSLKDSGHVSSAGTVALDSPLVSFFQTSVCTGS